MLAKMKGKKKATTFQSLINSGNSRQEATEIDARVFKSRQSDAPNMTGQFTQELAACARSQVR